MNTMPITMLNGFGCAECGGSCGQKSINGFGEAPPIIYWNTEPNKSADGREVSWSCNEWIFWHKKIAEKFGVPRANEVTQQWWDKLPWYDKKKLTCFWDCGFYNYFRTAGGGWSSIIPSLKCTIDSSGGQLIENTGKVVDNAGKAVANTTEAAANTTKVAKYLVPGIAVFVVCGAGYFIYKNYLKGNKKIKVGAASLGATSSKRKSKNK